ncbi:ROK family transcriptional regulator [uncultured Cohaesibacter sp.]|uniref:ROK family transcriptional regulator n=1 Tax=uncultured Cohaesibacter sp. TaxID=1002546 RepID=UPI00292F857A|nr:ROK family transcriptional regulator [uncultured Cohaesibacter sp.]
MNNNSPQAQQSSYQKGSNQVAIRSYNERLVLQLIRDHGAVTKAEATRATGLSPNAISTIFRSLEADGFVLRNEPIRGRIGQPSTPMSINPDVRYYVSLAIGRKSMELAVIDFMGRIKASRRIIIPYPTPQLALSFFNDNLTGLLRSAKQKRSTIAGMGVTMPFELWSWTSEFGAPPEEMDAWREFDLVAALQELVPWEILFENDATAACRAELVFGSRSQFQDWIYFFVGTFIGGGIVLNGSVFSGRKGNAGGFGPMRVPDKEGDRLVDHASLIVLEHMLTTEKLDMPDIHDESIDWERLEPVLSNWIVRAARNLAHATVSALAVIDFEGVVIDGAFPETIRTRLVEEFRHQMDIIDLQGVTMPDIDAGHIGRKARVLGGAARLINQNHMIDQNTLLRSV